MSQSPISLDSASQKTRLAYVFTSILNAPFWGLFNMLPFILYKDLQATPLQITLIIILKPAVSLIALYWGSFIEKRTDYLIPNVILAKVISHLPFFLFPFINSPWFFIFSFGFYMVLARGVMPAWMEILKINIPDVFREKVFAQSASISHIGAAIIPFVLGGLLDSLGQSWRFIFPVTALLSLFSIFFMLRIPVLNKAKEIHLSKPQILFKTSFVEYLVKPWKSAWKLLCRRKDYAYFQLGFMLGGSGLIIMQPALPVFFMDRLNLSYTELAVALTLCKGVGFALTSPYWAALINKIDIYRFNSWITLLAFLFPITLLLSQNNLMWLYGGYILYGIMQAGSEMSWHLSGPLFSKDEESSVYSNINVLTVGLRGCFIPILGSLLAYIFQASGVMIIGSALCLTASFWMAYYSRKMNLLEIR